MNFCVEFFPPPASSCVSSGTGLSATSTLYLYPLSLSLTRSHTLAVASSRVRLLNFYRVTESSVDSQRLIYSIIFLLYIQMNCVRFYHFVYFDMYNIVRDGIDRPTEQKKEA